MQGTSPLSCAPQTWVDGAGWMEIVARSSSCHRSETPDEGRLLSPHHGPSLSRPLVSRRPHSALCSTPTPGHAELPCSPHHLSAQAWGLSHCVLTAWNLLFPPPPPQRPHPYPAPAQCPLSSKSARRPPGQSHPPPFPSAPGHPPTGPHPSPLHEQGRSIYQMPFVQTQAMAPPWPRPGRDDTTPQGQTGS